MKFKEEVKEYFRAAGWHEGRSVMSVYDAISRFEEFPDFLKSFLYEYGDLQVETHKYRPGDITAVLNLKALPLGYFKINDYLDNPRFFGNIVTYPFADYHLDSSSLECDAEGKVYIVGDSYFTFK